MQITKLRSGSYYKNAEFELMLAENEAGYFSPTGQPRPACDACGQITKYMLTCWGKPVPADKNALIRCTSCVPASSLEKAYYRFA